MFTISGQRVFTLREVAALTDTPERTVRWRAAQGWLRVQGGPYGRLVLEQDLRAYAAKRGIALQLPDDLTEEEREEPEARRAAALAREEREKLEGVQRYYRSLRGDDGTTDEGEEDEPSLAESIAAARERWDAECAQRDREREAEERTARAEIERETRERQEAEIARLAREAAEREADAGNRQ